MTRQHSIPSEQNKRRTVTFTIRGELMDRARQLGINASRAAEQGLESEVKQALAAAWLLENGDKIERHNQRIAKQGMLLRPVWADR